MESELGRLILQIVGLIATAVAIALLVLLAAEPRDEQAVKDDRPDRIFP